MKFLQLQNGGLINLHWIAGVHCLLDGDESRVIALDHRDDELTLFYGSRHACLEYWHWLREQLPLIAYPGFERGESQVPAREERE